jgi:aminopeptidase C
MDFDFDMWHRKRLFRTCSEATLKAIVESEIRSARKYVASVDVYKERAKVWLPKTLENKMCDRIDRTAKHLQKTADSLEKDLDFKVKLIAKYGYIDKDMIPQAINVLGGDQRVQVTTPTGEKGMAQLRNLHEISEDQKVSLYYETYERLYKEWGI